MQYSLTFVYIFICVYVYVPVVVVVQSLSPILCDPMDCSMPGFSVFCCLPEFAQIHVH